MEKIEKLKLFFSVLVSSVLLLGAIGFVSAADPGVEGANCGAGAPCGTGLNCVATQCRAACTDNSQCPNNQYCNFIEGSYGGCTDQGTPGAPAPSPNPNPGTSPTPSPSPSGNSGGCPEGLSKEGNGPCLPAGLAPTTGLAASKSLGGLISNIIKILLLFAGSIAVVMVVLGGFWYMTSGGNEETAEKGKKTIFNFVLGLALIILAYTVVTIISDLLTNSNYVQ